jgi:hypothetical protein
LRDSIDQILLSFSDLLQADNPDRITELEVELSDIGFDGLRLSAPVAMDPSWSGIPVLAVNGRSNLRAWEAEYRKNAYITVTNLKLGTTRIMPLYNPPQKKMSLQPKPPKPVGDAAKGRKYGCVRYLVGGTLAGGLQEGDYALGLIYWDWASNIEVVTMPSRPGKPLLPGQVLLSESSWPPSFIYHTSASGTPDLDGDTGFAVSLAKIGQRTEILGVVGTKARPVHLPPPSASKSVSPDKDIHAGIKVDLILLTKDLLAPEHHEIFVPIFSNAASKPGDPLKGTFAVPLPFEPRKAEMVLYAFSDGMRAGPFPIPSSEN